MEKKFQDTIQNILNQLFGNNQILSTKYVDKVVKEAELKNAWKKKRND